MDDGDSCVGTSSCTVGLGISGLGKAGCRCDVSVNGGSSSNLEADPRLAEVEPVEKVLVVDFNSAV